MLWLVSEMQQEEAETCGRKGTWTDQTEEEARREIRIVRRTQSAIGSFEDAGRGPGAKEHSSL